MIPFRIWMVLHVCGLLLIAMCGGCTGDVEHTDQWHRLIRAVEPVHKRLGEPKEGQWLASNQEPGQTYDDYRRGRPIRPIGPRNKIYIQPLGDMSARHTEIVERTAEYMEVFFDTPVEIRKPMSLAKIPSFAERESKEFGKQLLTTWVLRDVLSYNLPKDATAYFAFTPRDLWAGGSSSEFVFGQSDLRARVGVWSLARNGDPEKNYKHCLRRSIKTATHETSHMFSMMHCTKWECNMGGSMTKEESDTQPLSMCPECVAKISWACTARPRGRLQDLLSLCDKFELTEDGAQLKRSLAALDPEKFQ